MKNLGSALGLRVLTWMESVCAAGSTGNTRDTEWKGREEI